MDATIIDITRARARRGAGRHRPMPASFRGGVAAAWAMFDDGELHPHELLELCWEATREA
jgi:hypothetical protein